MRKKDKPKYYLLGAVVVSLVFGVVFLGGTGSGNSLYLNTVPLSFNEQFRDINCQAFNEILIDGRLVDSGEDGFQPLVDSTTLNLQDGSRDVNIITIQLTMECKGDFIKDSSSTIVSGDFKMLLCGGSSPTRCIVSDDRSFEQLDGIASSTTQYATVPIEPQVVPKDNENFTVWKGNISASFLESLFPEGKSVVLVSKMFPNFTFQFNHPSGIIVAKQDSFAVNDVVYAQYNGLSNVAPPPVDSDGDGIPDGQDSCTGQPEDFNGFEDEDGCPDAFKLLDDDNDGVTNINDLCPSVFGLASNLGCPEDGIPPDSQAECESKVTIIPETETHYEKTIVYFWHNDQCHENSIACTAQVINACGVDGITYNTNNCDIGFKFPEMAHQGVCGDTVDADGDGVIDSGDFCPNTPANTQVDGNGCELITNIIVVTPTASDTDGDGIADTIDDCPNERGSFAYNGCPAPVTTTPVITDPDNPFANVPDLVNPTTQTPPLHEEPTTTETQIISGFDNSSLLVVGVAVGLIAIVGVIVKGKVK